MGWICKEVVIGYNLCLFAEMPLWENKLYIYISVVCGSDPQLVAATVLIHEMIVHSEKTGTAIVVALDYYPKDFKQYMSLVQYQ